MADDIQPIFELKKKLRALQDWAIQVGDGSLSSERAISRSIKVNRSTFKSNIANESLSVSAQEALALAFRFRTGWPEWRDHQASRDTPSDRRRDTAKAFREKFLAAQSDAACLTIDPGMTQKYIDRRFADFRFAVPGSFAPLPQSAGIPLVLSVSFDGRGWPILLQGTKEVLTVGLRQVDLQVFYERRGAMVQASAISCRGPEEGNFRGTVEGLAPWWIITVAQTGDMWLRGRRLLNDGQDCVCQGFQVGDTIRAVMTARANDCFVKVPGQLFEDASESKLRFIEHLHKLAVLNGTEAILGEQTLTVVNTI